VAWVNQGMLSLDELGRIAAEKPVVVVMHDMWCMTGACHHALDCKGYIDDCGHCRYFRSGREEYDIGYCVHKSQWGRGFGTEIVRLAVDWVRAQGGKRVTAEVADANRGSRSLLEKCGFEMGQASEFEKYHMGVRYPSHIYQLTLAREGGA